MSHHLHWHRIAWLAVLLYLLFTFAPHAIMSVPCDQGCTIATGILTATESELMDDIWYFGVGVGMSGEFATSIAVAKDSSGGLRLKSLRGKRVTLLVRVDE